MVSVGAGGNGDALKLGGMEVLQVPAFTPRSRAEFNPLSANSVNHSPIQFINLNLI